MPEPDASDGRTVTFTYRNHRGEVAVRRVLPRLLRFGTSPWHVEPQWLLEALDVGLTQDRTFAVRDITGWAPA